MLLQFCPVATNIITINKQDRDSTVNNLICTALEYRTEVTSSKAEMHKTTLTFEEGFYLRGNLLIEWQCWILVEFYIWGKVLLLHPLSTIASSWLRYAGIFLLKLLQTQLSGKWRSIFQISKIVLCTGKFSTFHNFKNCKFCLTLDLILGGGSESYKGGK